MKVYLAGPILGLTEAEAMGWRGYVDSKLKPHSIIGISPLRCEPARGERYELGGTDPLFDGPVVGMKNFFDVQECNIILAYMPKPLPGKRPSQGTIAEIAWGKALGKPVILLTDDDELAAHPVIRFCASVILDDMEKAIAMIIGLLDGYVGGKNV